MRRRRNPPAFGGSPILSKTPSPQPTENTSDTQLALHATSSAPLPHKAISITRVASFEFPELIDYELDQLKYLPRQYLAARYNCAVFSDLMRDFMERPVEFQKNAAKKGQEKLVRKYAKAHGAKTTLGDIANILKSITKACTRKFDLEDRISYLVDRLEKGDNLEILLSHSSFSPDTLLTDFTHSYRALHYLKRRYLRTKMVEVINELSYHDISNLVGLLAYTSQPNIPGERIPRFPFVVAKAIASRLNHPPKDLSNLFFVITNYLELAKQINPDPEACNKVLIDFIKEYVGLSTNEKKIVNAEIEEQIKQIKPSSVDHLQGILKFIQSNDISGDINHHFPPSILLSIEATIHKIHQARNITKYFTKIIEMNNVSANYSVVQPPYNEFYSGYCKLQDETKRAVISEMISCIHRMTSIEFNKNRIFMTSIKEILGSNTLTAEIRERIQIEDSMKYEAEDELHSPTSTGDQSGLTAFSMFNQTPSLPSSIKPTVLRNK